MTAIYAAAALGGVIPLLKAWLANRETTLLHSLNWAAAAWIAWCIALVWGDPELPGEDPLRLLALFLTGAAGVAVFGARRPIVGAWNFVVLGLLCVLLLPLAESLFLGTPSLGPVRVVFVAATLAIGVLNYLPTRFAPAAFALGAALAGECVFSFATDRENPAWMMPASHLLLLGVPWIAWVSWSFSRRASTTPFDRLWLDFRDAFGVVWGQRIREQFNRAAANAHWPVHLSWQGIVSKGDSTPEQQAEMIAAFESMLRRFR